MSVSEQRLRDWIEKADHDLGTALVINEHIPYILTIILSFVFHLFWPIRPKKVLFLSCMLLQTDYNFSFNKSYPRSGRCGFC
jgi:hypothetical protein